MNDNATARPCPLCASEDIEIEGWLDGGGKHGPECMGCGATASTLEIWNTRPLEDELEAKLEKQMLASEEDIQNWIIALQSFKTRCVGLRYEKNIIDGMMKLIGSYPKNEWFEEKEQELIEDFKQEKELTDERT